MSEELIQRNLLSAPEHMGTWDYYNIGATTLSALKSAKIIPQKDYAELERKKPDALIIKKPQVIAAIEYKKPSQLKTKKQIQVAIEQELDVARAIGAKIYIVTDGSKSFWLNPLTGKQIVTENGEPISFVFNQHSSECIKLINKIISSIGKDNDTILTSSIVDPLPLAQQVWQDLWAVSGATPENCLYTFVEVFIFKYLSDLGVLSGMYSFDNLLAQYRSNNENAVLEYYAGTVRKEIKKQFPMNEKDKTTIINGTIFVSKDDRAVAGYATVFKKILDRFEKFGTLENIDYDFKSKLFETFLKESISKKNWGQFFTPLKVVRSVVNMIDIRPGMSICDPACGVGKFLLEPILHDIGRYYKVENGSLVPQIKLVGFDKGFDKDEQKTIILAKANMLIYMSSLIRDNPSLTVDFAKLFNDTFLLQTNSILGTLAHPIKDEYDLILTNPPYVMSGSSNLKDEISKKTAEETKNKQKSLLEQYYAVSAMGVEGLFMEWIVRALKPDGKAFVIVPDGVMNRSNDKRLRDFILDECNIDAVISLPINTFFTTNKKTYILAITKKRAILQDGVPVKERQNTPVFTYLCSEIGETRDNYRFDIEQNDLDSAATLFNMFKGVRGALPVEDKRCKIVSIDEFYNGTHWSVERWWTQEERVELGIENEKESVSPNELGTMIGEFANTLLEYEDMLSVLQKKNDNVIVQTKEIDLSDENYFQYINASQLGLTKAQLVDLPKGDIPVFTAAQEPILFIDVCRKKPITATAEKPVLSFANDGDGSAGRNFVYHTSDFYINASRTAFRIINDDLSLKFVQLSISDMKQKYGFSYTYKANRQNLKNVKLNVPIDTTGGFNLELQQNIVQQFELIEQLRQEMALKNKQISTTSVNIDLAAYNMVYKPLAELLEPIRGKSVYTRKYGEQNKGEFPVYSAAAIEPLTYINDYDYDGSFLSWSTNGFAGTVIVLDGKFSINGDRGILIPKIKDIDILYLRYILEPIFRGLAKGRKGDNGTDEFTKLYPSMILDIQIPIPTDDENKISIKLQEEIANIYRTVEQYKKEICEKIETVIAQKITFDN